ncbi:alpha/beta hydrolase [Streptomyces carminius]|uniref:Alpha/beta hydrolase n=1 Tax=Streptomyces carminius TaxID=2665496 RepID=A0A2M8LXY2_9ACTN|nr:alpha/beta hydrolase [Streptomyces carminius]PJE96812.1 alpha/beta hydrolase [Streptomyces carminius]
MGEIMFRKINASVVTALCCTVAGVGLVGCEESTAVDSKPSAATTPTAQDTDESVFSGTGKIDVEGMSVNVSCSGSAAEDGPVIVLLSGLGDGLDKMAAFQKTLSEKNRVCSYDRLGEGASDQPEGPQSFESTGEVLTAVLDRVAGDSPVVLAGHSLGGVIAARYATDHQDRVKGLVLLDATSPTNVADVNKVIPESATGPGAELRTQALAIHEGQNPEQLVIPDGEVRSAGDIPVEVVQHGQPYLAAVPEYGPLLERTWAEGQRKWLAVSGDSRLSTAEKSGHYIHVDQPDVAAEAIERVTAQAAR